jgi:hypothetical protein
MTEAVQYKTYSLETEIEKIDKRHDIHRFDTYRQIKVHDKVDDLVNERIEAHDPDLLQILLFLEGYPSRDGLVIFSEDPKIPAHLRKVEIEDFDSTGLPMGKRAFKLCLDSLHGAGLIAKSDTLSRDQTKNFVSYHMIPKGWDYVSRATFGKFLEPSINDESKDNIERAIDSYCSARRKLKLDKPEEAEFLIKETQAQLSNAGIEMIFQIDKKLKQIYYLPQ